MTWRIESGNAPAAIAGVNPTLDYRFAIDRSEIEVTSLTDKLTFTRPSIGTYVSQSNVIETANNNIPRFNSRYTNNPGLIVEPQRINRLIYSTLPPLAGLGTANRIGSNCLTGTNTAIAPDGTLSAYTVNPSASYSYVGVGGNQFSVVSGTTYRASIWVKKFPGITYSNLSFVVNGWASPDVVSFNYQLNNSNDWIRVSATFTSNITASRDFFLIRQQSGSAVASQPLYVWGQQIEIGSTLTTFIPTGATTVTRSADSAIINGTGVITGTYTMVEKPAGCAVVNGTNIDLVSGYTAERVMVFPTALSAGQITSIRNAM